MKIIVLCGTNNSGKSAALNKLVSELSKSGTIMPGISNVPTGVGMDVRWVVEKEKMRIGICTGGDTAEIISDNFKFFADNKCDVAISALRHNDKQWPLCQELIKLCKDDIPMFVWKTQRYGETKKWSEDELDMVVVCQILEMINM